MAGIHLGRIQSSGSCGDLIQVTGSMDICGTGSFSKVGIGTSQCIAELDVAGKIAISSESSTPAQPANGKGYLYTKSDGKIYWRSYDISETDLTATGGGSTAADDISAGEAAVSISTSTGNITIDSNAGSTELDGHTGVKIASTSSGNVTLDSVTGIIDIQDGGSSVLTITEGNSGDVTVKLVTNAKDLIFTDNGDAENFRILDAAAGVAFKTDGAAIKFGADGEVTLTHVHDTGLLLSDASGVGTTKLMFGDSACFIQQQADGELGIDADSIINVTAPTLDIDASTAVTIDTDTVTVASANATDPLFIIKNTTSDADGARLRFVKDKGAAGAANDVAGLIEFYADDANQDQVLFSEIKSQVAVHTDGQEGGKLTLSVASHDGESQPGLIIADGSAEDEVDVTIGNGADSLVTISGDLDIPNGGFALGSDASGDMYYRNSSGVLTRIAVGSDNHVLTLDGAVPGWEAAAGGGEGAGATYQFNEPIQQVNTVGTGSYYYKSANGAYGVTLNDSATNFDGSGESFEEGFDYRFVARYASIGAAHVSSKCTGYRFHGWTNGSDTDDPAIFLFKATTAGWTDSGAEDSAIALVHVATINLNHDGDELINVSGTVDHSFASGDTMIYVMAGQSASCTGDVYGRLTVEMTPQ